MTALVTTIAGSFYIMVWIAGCVLASGFWSTLAAICIPFYAWYLVVERIMGTMGWLA